MDEAAFWSRPVDKPHFPLLRSEGGMSPINIPIKPPPRVNTANGVNRGGGRDCDRKRKKKREKRGRRDRDVVGGSANTRTERKRERKRRRGREIV